jgi:hypothetical protein
MTRRTPEPGDSYTKGTETWRIVAVTHLESWETEPAGVLVQTPWADRVPLSLTQFHQCIALATWGRA